MDIPPGEFPGSLLESGLRQPLFKLGFIGRVGNRIISKNFLARLEPPHAANFIDLPFRVLGPPMISEVKAAPTMA